MKNLEIDKSTWKLTKLGDLAIEISTRVDNPSQSGIERFVGLKHFISGNLKIKNWSKTENLISSTKAFEKGDILFARRNAYLRRASIVEFDGVCSGDAFVLRENYEKIVPGFLAFVVNSNSLWDFANSNSAGTMSKRVKWRDLSEYEFLLPPKDQQAQLAELLWAVDKVIEKELEVLKTSNSLIDRKMEYFFIKGNGCKKNKNFTSYIIPAHWNVEKMEDIANVEYGISKSVANNTNPEIGWQIITGANIKLDGSFDMEKKRYIEKPSNERFLLQEGDLLFNWRSGSPEHIGKTAIFDLKDSYTYASFILRIRCGEKLNNKYLFYYLNFLRKKEFFTKNISKQVNFKINATVFRSIEIPVPQRVEQEKILLILESLNSTIKTVKSRIFTSKSLQKSLINQIF